MNTSVFGEGSGKGALNSHDERHVETTCEG